MRFLLIKLLIFTILLFSIACTTHLYNHLPQTKNTPHILPALSLEKKVLYTAVIDVYGHRINGLIALKKMKSGETRIACLAQSAIKLAEFRCDENRCKTTFVMPQLEKGRVSERLQEDFQLLLMRGAFVRQFENVFCDKENKMKIYRFGTKRVATYYSVESGSGHVVKIEKSRNNKVFLTISLSDYDGDGVPTHIVIKRKNIKVEMKTVVW